MSEKMRLKIVVTTGPCSVIPATTVASITTTMNDPRILDRCEVTQYGCSGNTESESFIRGVYQLGIDNEFVSRADISAEIKDFDAVLLVRNGADFNPDDVIALLDAYLTVPNTNEDRRFLTAKVRYGSIWGVESDGKSATLISSEINNDKVTLACSALSLIPAVNIPMVIKYPFIESISLSNREDTEFHFTFCNMDSWLCYTMRPFVVDTEIKFTAFQDIHKDFHVLLNDVVSKKDLVDPRNISIDGGIMLHEYTQAVKEASFAKTENAVNGILKTVLGLCQQIGVKVDISGVDQGLMLKIAMSGEPVKNTEVQSEETPNNIIPIQK